MQPFLPSSAHLHEPSQCSTQGSHCSRASQAADKSSAPTACQAEWHSGKAQAWGESALHVYLLVDRRLAGGVLSAKKLEAFSWPPLQVSQASPWQRGST